MYNRVRNARVRVYVVIDSFIVKKKKNRLTKQIVNARLGYGVDTGFSTTV